MFLILRRCLDAPYFCIPLYIHIPLRGVHPICSPYSCASVCSQRCLHVVGGCKGPLYIGHFPYTSPCMGVPPRQFYIPAEVVGFPVHWYVLGILVCHRGIFPSVGGLGGSAHETAMCSFLYISVVCYVSHFYYGYDYYSSNYGGIFWPVISFFSDCGSFLDGASCNIGSVRSGSTTTLDAKRLWRCYCLCLCATAATSIFDAYSGLCQLCYGFSTGRFHFKS